MLDGRRWLWLTLLALAALAAVERFGLPALRESRSPTGAARWIWAPDATPQQGAVAFFAVRDFEVPAAAASGSVEALLRVAADEVFGVALNGEAIGSGSWAPGRALSVYRVGRYLKPGVNRLLVELRSGRGVGGLLLSLRIAGETPLEVASDGSWRIVREYRPGLAIPGGPLTGAVAAREWGRPPLGRWGRPVDGDELPTRDELALSGAPEPARRCRIGDPAGRWIALPRAKPDPRGLGRWVTFDFGEERTGFLEIDFSDRATVSGLVFGGNELPDPRIDRPEFVLIKAAGLARWSAAEPRRFRYVTVVALDWIAGARMLAVDSGRAAPLLVEQEPSDGVFGLRSPALRPAVEDRFWRELERVNRL